jgi:ABC-type sugar transport system, periplasmic component
MVAVISCKTTTTETAAAGTTAAAAETTAAAGTTAAAETTAAAGTTAAAAETTAGAAVSEADAKALRDAVGYDWNPTDPSKWVVTTSYKKDPPYTIALSTNHMAVTWMDIYKAEMVDELKGYGDKIKEFIHVDAGGDAPTQIANIEDLISRKVDAIIIDPASPTAIAPVVEKAYAAGIVTIVSKSGIATTKYTAFQNNDEVQFGASGAQWLVDQLGGKPGVVLGLRGIAGYGVDIERWTGAQSVFSKHPEIQVFAEYADWSYDKAKEVSKALLAAHPDFVGIYSEGGQMSRAMVDAMVEAGLDPAKYPQASEDDNGFCKQVIKYNLNACASGKPVWLSRLAVRAALDALRGITIEKYVMVPSPFYGPEDIKKIAKPNVSDLSWLTTTLSDAEINAMFAGK